MFSMNIKEVDTQELARWMEDESKDFRIIDVREVMEIAQGSIAGADPMPISVIGNHLHEIEKDRPVVFVCRSGVRSAQVCAYLQQNLGHDNAYNLRGGMMAWVQGGNPVAAVMQRSA